jgi:hypothetical protein
VAYIRVKPTFISIKGVIFRWVDPSSRKALVLHGKKKYHDLSMNGRMMNVDQLSVKVAFTPNIPHALWPASEQHHYTSKS